MERFFKSYILVGLLLMYCATAMADGADRIVQMPKCKGTVYQLLEKITEKTGMMFIYDSKIINNQKRTEIKKGTYSIRLAVCEIVGNTNLDIKSIGNHILITLPVTHTAAPVKIKEKKCDVHFVIEGTLLDKSTRKPVEAGSVGVQGSSIGSVTNSNGEFRLVLPDSLHTSKVVFSHIGYENQVIEASLLEGTHCIVGLQGRVIPIQEVVVRLTNPIHLLRQMYEKKWINYSSKPTYTMSFYREGVESGNRFVNLNEGVFKVYKPSNLSGEKDQVKLLKMRTISSQNKKDTIVAKIKAGVDACLTLDIIKNIPDYLSPVNDEYRYFSTGVTTIDGRPANIVYFEQRPDIDIPLFCGDLYIDSENHALLGANIEVNPRYVKSSADIFIEKKSKEFGITPQKITYSISYKQWGGHYYINYVRGDLHFKIKYHKRWFGGTSHLHTWFEMATCKIDSQEVKSFSKNELLPRRTIFEDTNYSYDNNFWENFNVIPIENNLSESIGKIALMIEETLGN